MGGGKGGMSRGKVKSASDSTPDQAAMGDLSQAKLTIDTFSPRRFIRDGHVQTLLARRRPSNSVALRTEQPMLLDAGPDETGYDTTRPVQLLGYYNAPLRPSAAFGLVVIFHGWEGSSHSADAQFIADELLRSGFATMRLNFRDHGPNLQFDRMALNRGPFVGTLLHEVETAVRQSALLAEGKPLYIVGGSMGGNFALRLAARHAVDPIPNLRRVIAICPAIDPAAAAHSIDATPGYRNFFRWRWYQSLRAKQACFPDIYDFSPLTRMKSVWEMTEYVTAHYTEWKSAEECMAHYTFAPRDAVGLTVPTTIIAAEDDAVIPAAGFREFEPSENFQIHMHRTGGHMGFVDIFPYRRWLPPIVAQELRESLGADH